MHTNPLRRKSQGDFVFAFFHDVDSRAIFANMPARKHPNLNRFIIKALSMESEDNEFLDLPDDPEEAFAILNKRLYKRIDDAWESNNNNADMLMREYVEVLLAFADIHELGVLDFFSRDIPHDAKSFSEYFRQIHDVTRRESQRILIQAAKKQKLNSNYSVVLLDNSARSAIHVLIASLKEKLNSLDLSDAKRESLFNKLNAFAAEVDRNRTRTEAFLAFAIEVSRAGKDISDNIKPFQQTIDRVLDLIDKAKNLGGNFLPGRGEQKKLEAPTGPAPDADEDTTIA